MSEEMKQPTEQIDQSTVQLTEQIEQINQPIMSNKTHSKKLDQLKNPIFIANSTDPLNGKYVKEIRAEKHMKDTQFKKDRIKYDLVWQYMRDRGRQSVESIYKKYANKPLKVIYSGDSVVYDFVYVK